MNAVKSHRYNLHIQKNLANVNFDLSKLARCVLCSTQLANKEALKKHLQDKHSISEEKTEQVGWIGRFSTISK